MAYVEDIQDEEQRRLQGAQAGPAASDTAPAAGPAPASAPKAAGPASSGGSYVPLASYFTANEPAAQEMAGGLAADVTAKGRDAVASWDANKVPDAQEAAQALGTQEGIAGGLEKKYDRPDYSAGMSGLDAYLATRGSGGQFQAIKDQFGSLDWSPVGTDAPSAPTMGDLGTAPTKPTQPTYETVHTSDPNSSEAQNVSVNNDRARQKYEADLAKYQADQAAYDAAVKAAQDKYAAENTQYQADRNQWDTNRQPLLDAFGLGTTKVDRWAY